MKVLLNLQKPNLHMFGGTLIIYGNSYAEVSDASADTDEVFSLKRQGIIKVLDKVPEGVSEAPPEPAYEFTKLEILGSEEYPEKVETPVVETPVVETPVVETPVVETPVVETPVVETPVVETPVVETPVVAVKKSKKE